MPVTITYDLRDADTNQRNYVRSMFERLHWRRLGGSVLRYSGEEQPDGSMQEDWMNHVAPALMLFRAYLIKHAITLKFFTLDTSSVAHVDYSDPGLPLGHQPQVGEDIAFATPTNAQSSEAALRDFVNAATIAAP